MSDSRLFTRRQAIGVASAAAALAVAAPSVSLADELSEGGQDAAQVTFAYIESPQVALGGTQNVALGTGLASDVEITSATLDISCSLSGQSLSLPMTKAAEGAALFTFDCSDEGDWQIDALSVQCGDGTELDIPLSNLDGVSSLFSVVAAELISDDDQQETKAVVIDENDEMVAAESVEEAASVAGADTSVGAELLEQSQQGNSAVSQASFLGGSGLVAAVATCNPSRVVSDHFEKSSVIASAAAGSKLSQARDSSGNFVIAIDPGHGGYDSGATGNGAKEADLTWKIANVCAAELSAYAGVSVYMTRSQNECPTIKERVERAANANADVIVSVHINAGGGRGAEVWVPYNSSYNTSLYGEGVALGSAIENQLTALGLNNRGVNVRPITEHGSYDYPDGSYGDYYGIIRYARQRGFVGIIVEHAFIDNAADFNQYLSSDAKLQALGLADANGIVSAYGLQMDTSKGSPIFRLYNPNSGEHFYTGSSYERNSLVAVGWQYEGIAWYCPSDGIPVYRVYNPNAGDHHYTTNKYEYDSLGKVGWNCEGVSSYAMDDGAEVYRLYNPNAKAGAHHFTLSAYERDSLVKAGWKYEGVAWRATA